MIIFLFCFKKLKKKSFTKNYPSKHTSSELLFSSFLLRSIQKKTVLISITLTKAVQLASKAE